MTELRFKAILFDLDGTLIEFKFPIKESRIAMFDFLKNSGFNVDHFSENIRTQDLIDATLVQWSKSQDLKKRDFKEVRADLFAILDALEYKSMPTAKLFPNCLKVVGKIKQMGGKVGIVTNSGRGPAQALLDDYGLLNHLDLVLTRNEMRRMKPSPDGLLEAVRLLGLKTNDALYIGDSILDIESAKCAGIKCASVATGSHRADELRLLSPDYMLKSLNDVERLLVGMAI